MRITGTGTEADPVKSLEWNLKAAEAGDASGMLNAGIDYELGTGTEENPEEETGSADNSTDAENEVPSSGEENCPSGPDENDA